MPVVSVPPLTFGRLFTQWQWHPVSALVTLILIAGYAAGVYVVRRRGKPWPAVRTLAWFLAVALLVLATAGGIAVYSDALFWMHMVAHLVLIMVVPLGLIWGRPLDLAIAASGSKGPALERTFHGPAVSLITFPLLTLGLYAVVIAGTHLTDFMNTMMMHPWLHGLESAIYVVVGVLFFAPLVSSTPLRWQLSEPMRIMLMVLAMPVDTFTGVVLGQTSTFPWPMMAMMRPAWAPDPIDDLHAGGAVMWIGGDAIMAILMGVAAVAWVRAAGSGESSELGGWLSAARVNTQRDFVTGHADDEGDGQPAEARTGDSDDDLADYNRYLERLNRGG